ncbi:DNA-directed RNA polymerase I subunit RPA34 [Monodelphis domestica]|uniref:DNA-directed RNA polymerase I subunit RPA34 n=1 Tax=Monodelphis domestica TaxID=13616 RepID=UPI00028BCC5E|nr:DNA-directed RNA polymerase I subunit RPA34 [Monodelphis domestica]
MTAEALRSPLCPDDFCPAALPSEPPPPLALDALRKPDTELWLIRTPADFSPASLNGCKVPLVGFQTLKSHRNEAGIRQRYQVLSSTSTGPETLLAPGTSADGQLVPAPALQGTLSVIEVPRNKLSGQFLHAIPTSPPPQIPPGLRPRFQAFGGRQPVVGPPAPSGAGKAREMKSPQKRKKSESVSLSPRPQEVLIGEGGPDSAPGQALGQEMPELKEQMAIRIEEEVAALLPIKKKKKKKKEQEGEVQEPAGEVPVMELRQEASFSPTKPKKSKKKRELEREMIEQEERQPEAEVQADPPKESTPSSAKKKSRRRQEAGGEMLEPEQAAGMKEEIAVPPSPKREKEEPGGEMLDQETVVTESIKEADSLPIKKKKKKRKKPEEGEEMLPEPPKETDSPAWIPESVTPNPGQGAEEKRKKKKKRL